MEYTTHLLLIVFLPLLAFVLLGLWGRSVLKNVAGLIGTGCMSVAVILSLIVASDYFFVQGKTGDAFQMIVPFIHTWLPFTGQLSIEMGAIVDPISVMMLVVVTFVSLMVHVFSLGYMKGEERFGTYYAFLGLFTFSMLGLVLSVNLFQIYIFWELVGVSSYLLIGFYFDKSTAVAASKKAFIVTRFADLGFLIGILILGIQGGTFNIPAMVEAMTAPASATMAGMTTAGFLGISALSWALALIFMGGAGKSAMFPLHIWLPDAMEGPTPVSALIHAATMVVAGVYLVARLFPIYAIHEVSLQLVTTIGVISAVIAAIIACTQTDIKRVLAYSTMSQIGFMMFALGVSGAAGEASLGYSASMFHLFTHAFFKSLLFLGAGAVIHMVHSNDVQSMGGLRKLMPVTHLAFLVACLAIAGVPPFAGFFSKESILLAAWHQNPVVYWIALITSGLTAFYMFRLYFLIFWHKPHPVHDAHHHGEGAWSMKLPLILLTLCTVIAGFIPFSEFVSSTRIPFSSEFHLSFAVVPVVVGITGILLAGLLYMKANDRPQKIASMFGNLYRFAYHKFYIDEIYLFLTRKIIFNLIGRPAAWFDRKVVDGAVRGSGTLTEHTAEAIKGMQSGSVQNYGLYFFYGILVLSFVFLYLWH